MNVKKKKKKERLRMSHKDLGHLGKESLMEEKREGGREGGGDECWGGNMNT